MQLVFFLATIHSQKHQNLSCRPELRDRVVYKEVRRSTNVKVANALIPVVYALCVIWRSRTRHTLRDTNIRLQIPDKNAGYHILLIDIHRARAKFLSNADYWLDHAVALIHVIRLLTLLQRTYIFSDKYGRSITTSVWGKLYKYTQRQSIMRSCI